MSEKHQHNPDEEWKLPMFLLLGVMVSVGVAGFILIMMYRP